MLTDIDKEFLRQLVSLQSMNNPVSAILLREAWVNPQKVTDLLYDFDPVLKDQLKDNNKKRDLNGHIQRIVSARLIAEVLNEIENLGSFYSAVAQRHDKGIFIQYAKSNDDHKKFFTAFNRLQTKQNLASILKIPKINELTNNSLNEEALCYIDKLHSDIMKWLSEITSFYTSKLSDVFSDSPYAFHVAYHIQHRKASKKIINQDNVNDMHDMVSVYNKIKHRFLVFSPANQINKLKNEIEEEDIKLTPISIKDFDYYFDLVIKTTNCIKSMAALLLYLDNEDIDIDKCNS